MYRSCDTRTYKKETHAHNEREKEHETTRERESTGEDNSDRSKRTETTNNQRDNETKRRYYREYTIRIEPKQRNDETKIRYVPNGRSCHVLSMTLMFRKMS